MLSVSYFNLIRHPDGRAEFVPTQPHNQWAVENRAALEAYARRIARDGTAAEQLQQYLAEHPEALAESDGEV